MIEIVAKHNTYTLFFIRITVMIFPSTLKTPIKSRKIHPYPFLLQDSVSFCVYSM